MLSSLDIVEEKLNASGKGTSDLRELYLGMLYSLETYKIYGYVTNTKIKFIIIVDSTNMALRDNEIRSVSQRHLYFYCFVYSIDDFPLFLYPH